jgi:heme-degrading monooxygenase HmoA
MILELADLLIHRGKNFEFESSVISGVESIISKSKGFRHYEFRRSVESSEKYILQIMWDTLEDHTVGFRGTPASVEWREMVDRFFARPPQVEHFLLVERPES